MKCKTNMPIDNPEVVKVTMPRIHGKWATGMDKYRVASKCPDCGANISRFVTLEQAKQIEEKQKWYSLVLG